MKRLKRNIIIFFCVAIAAAPVVTTVVYEDVGVDNLFVVFSKRAIAQAAGFVVSVHDPYKDKIRKAVLSPPTRTDMSNMRLLDSEQKLLDYINGTPYLNTTLKIKDYRNSKMVRTRFEFLYQPADEPQLVALRERFHLYDVVAAEKDDFNRLLKLCSWVNAQWQYGAPKRVSYNFNAIEILDRAKNNERFFCSEYATVFTQCALSIGYQARYVGLRNHVVSEAWSDEYQKWIMLDPTFCIYFAKDGIPLNCLQIHNASLGGGGIDMIVFSDAIDAKNFNQKQILKNYENFYIRMRNDWLTNRFPHWYPLSNSIMNGVQWRDKDTKPLVSVLRKTFEKDDLYWPLNQTNIAIVPSEEPFRFKVFLKTTTPNFLCFKVVVNNRQFELKDTDQIEWVMAPGENTIMASSVNVFGKEGKPSFIKVAFYE